MLKFNKKFGLVVVTFVTGKFDKDYEADKIKGLALLKQQLLNEV